MICKVQKDPKKHGTIHPVNLLLKFSYGLLHILVEWTHSTKNDSMCLLDTKLFYRYEENDTSPLNDFAWSKVMS